MFDNYVGAKTKPLPRWVGPLVFTSVGVHIVVILFFVAKSYWTINKLAVPDVGVRIAVAPPPPPPPPPPPAGKKQTVKPKTDAPVKIKPTEMTQPVKIENPEEIDEDEGVEFGVEGGVPGGVAGGVPEGVVGGVLGGPPPPPPPPPKVEPEEPKVVPQVALEQKRLSGNKQIVPDDEVKLQIKREAKTRVITTVKMCLSTGGNVTSLRILKSSGYPSYDNKIKGEMRQWKYSPFTVNGKAVPVCTSVTFIYNQKN